MDLSGAVRAAVYQAVSNISVDSKLIPVFDGTVNPLVTIPVVRNASVYIVIQDQQENEAALQNMCAERITANITIRIVTKFTTANVTDRTVCDTISGLVQAAIRTGRTHNLTANDVYIQKVTYPIARNIDEFAGGQTALSKVLIYSITVNN